MKMNFKKVISLVVCICFVCSFCMSSFANAASNEIIDENIFKVVQNNDKVCTVTATYKGDKLYATLDKETREITMQTVEKSKMQILGLSLGKDKVTDYEVKVDTVADGEVSAIITDAETGKEYKISKNTDKVKAQAVVILPLIDILAGLALLVLNNIVATVVVAGITYYALSEIMEDVEDESYDYYAAYIVSNDDLYIAGSISYEAAVARMQAGKNILARTQLKAYGVAKNAYNGYTPVGPEKHSGSGHYYWHYHPYNRYYGSHAFYIAY